MIITYMLHVDLDKILTEEDAVGKITDIFNRVENEKETYIITKDGRPAVAIISIDQLEQQQGGVTMEENKPENPAPTEAPPTPVQVPNPAQATSLPPPPPPMDLPSMDLPPLMGTDTLANPPPVQEPTPPPPSPLQPPPPAN